MNGLFWAITGEAPMESRNVPLITILHFNEDKTVGINPTILDERGVAGKATSGTTLIQKTLNLFYPYMKAGKCNFLGVYGIDGSELTVNAKNDHDRQMQASQGLQSFIASGRIIKEFINY